jgi:hypothetical protein
MSHKGSKHKTEIRLSVAHASGAIEYYLNNYMLKHEVEVELVEWNPVDKQFRVVMRDLPKGDTGVVR